MNVEKICRCCGTAFVVGVLTVAVSTPPALCEKCRHEDEPHVPESTRTTFPVHSVVKIVSSTATVTTQPPWISREG